MPVLPQLAFWKTRVPSGVGFFWTGTNGTIPYGYARNTSLDGRFPKEVVNATTNPGGTGGSATHADHPGNAHVHVVDSAHATYNCADTNAFFAQSASGSPVSHQTHSHSVVVTTTNYNSGAMSGFNWNSSSNEPPYMDVIFITSTGISGIPNAAVAWLNTATLPPNWRACDGASGAPDLRNRFMKGAAGGGNGGGTGGASNSHTHTAPTHTHAAVDHTHFLTLQNQNGGGAGTAGSSVAGLHNHGGSTTTSQTITIGPIALNAAAANTTATGDGQPAWYKLYAVQNNGGISIPIGTIGIWTGTISSPNTIPGGWRLCDGTNGTPDLRDRFIKAVNTTSEIGNTGGALTHTHATGTNHTHVEPTHAHNVSGTTNGETANQNSTAGTAFNACTGSHNHGWGSLPTALSTVTSQVCAANANTENRPLFTDVAYIQYQQA